MVILLCCMSLMVMHTACAMDDDSLLRRGSSSDQLSRRQSSSSLLQESQEKLDKNVEKIKEMTKNNQSNELQKFFNTEFSKESLFSYSDSCVEVALFYKRAACLKVLLDNGFGVDLQNLKADSSTYFRQRRACLDTLLRSNQLSAKNKEICESIKFDLKKEEKAKKKKCPLFSCISQ